MDMENIRKKVERVFQIDISNSSRKHIYTYARACYYTLCIDLTAESLTNIGKSIGKHHATVIHALKEFPFMLKQSNDLKVKYHLLKKELLGVDIKVKKPEDLLYNYHRILLENIDLKKQIEQLKKEKRMLLNQIK